MPKPRLQVGGIGFYGCFEGASLLAGQPTAQSPHAQPAGSRSHRLIQEIVPGFFFPCPPAGAGEAGGAGAVHGQRQGFRRRGAGAQGCGSRLHQQRRQAQLPLLLRTPPAVGANQGLASTHPHPHPLVFSPATCLPPGACQSPCGQCLRHRHCPAVATLGGRHRTGPPRMLHQAHPLPSFSLFHTHPFAYLSLASAGMHDTPFPAHICSLSLPAHASACLPARSVVCGVHGPAAQGRGD